MVQAFLDHREERHTQIRECVASGVEVITDMVPLMYKGTPEFMYPAAARSVLAAVEYLVNNGELTTDGEITLDSRYRQA